MKKNELSIASPPRATRDHTARSGVGLVLVFVAIVVGGAALLKTLVKNKTHAIGREQEATERQIAALEQEIRALKLDIKEVLAPKHLKDRLATNRTQLREIVKKDIIEIPAVPVAKVPTPQ